MSKEATIDRGQGPTTVYITLSLFHTPFTPKVTSGASTKLCRLNEALASKAVPACQSVSIEDDFADIKDTTYKAAEEVMGFKTGRRHQDWFDENDAVVRRLLDTMHTTHVVWINNKGNMARKLEYNSAKQSAQVKLRTMK